MLEQIVIAAKLVAEGVDFEQVRPMIATAEREFQSAVCDSLRERGITT